MAIISAADHTLTLAKKIAMRALAAMPGRGVVMNHVNHYMLDGNGATALSLSTFDDIGVADSIGSGVEYTGEAAFGSTAVDITPTRHAKGGTIDKDTYLRRGGYTLDQVNAAINALPSIVSAEMTDDENMQVTIISTAFGIEINQLLQSIRIAAEKLLIDLFAGASQSVGSTGANLTVAQIDDGLALLEGVTLPHDDLVIILHPRQVADVRADTRSGTTNGGFTDDLTTLLRYSPGISTMGARGQVLGVPVYSYSAELALFANANADVVGAIMVRGEGNPEQADGSGKPGALALVAGHAASIAAEPVANAFGVRLVADQPLGAGERKDAWIVKVVSDAP
jgi:hypothetical protein